VTAGAFAAHVPITVHLDGGIFARNGAIGVVPPDIARAVVTPEFPVFTPNPDRLDAVFTRCILRTGELLASIRAKASGTSGRKRVTPGDFLSVAVPLPSIGEQRAMVAAYDGALADAAALEAQADDAEAAGLAAFEDALGIAAPAPLPDRPVFIARFAKLERWSHDAALRSMVGSDVTGSPHPIVRLGDVIADLENGWSPKCLDRPAEGDEWGVLKVSAISSGRYRADQNKSLPPALSPRSRLEIKIGDVLIARASGAASLVGVSAYVEATPGRLMLCDKLFRMISRTDFAVDPRFVAQVLKLQSVRAQVFAQFSSESGMMKNISKPALLALTFPLPTDIADQRRLIADLDCARAEAIALRAKAASLRADAWAAFEAAIYG
jgi:type I restriction enzyme, S subunit